MLVLLRCDLPVVDAGLGRLRCGKSGRGELGNDLVDVAAAVADHKQDFYHPGGPGRDWVIQIHYRAAGTVRIDRIGALFLAGGREFGREVSPL